MAARQHHTALASQLASQHTAMRLGGLGGMPAAAQGALPHNQTGPTRRCDPAQDGLRTAEGKASSGRSRPMTQEERSAH